MDYLKPSLARVDLMVEHCMCNGSCVTVADLQVCTPPLMAPQ